MCRRYGFKKANISCEGKRRGGEERGRNRMIPVVCGQRVMGAMI